MSVTLNKKLVQGNAGFSEISQTHIVKFAPAIVSKNVASTLTNPFKCRDFLIEAALSHHYKKGYSIYGFKLDCSVTDWEDGFTSLYMKFPNEKHKENFFTNLKLLNQFEEHSGIKPTTAVDVGGEHLAIIVSGDSVWKSKGFLISFYSFLLKCLIFDIDHKSNVLWVLQIPKTSTEWKRIDSIGEEKFSKFYQNFGKIIQIEGNVTGYTNEQTADVYDLHDNSGFVSIVHESDFARKNIYIETIEKILKAA